MILCAGNYDNTESITLQICTWYRVFGSSHVQNEEKDIKSMVYWFRKKTSFYNLCTFSQEGINSLQLLCVQLCKFNLCTGCFTCQLRSIWCGNHERKINAFEIMEKSLGKKDPIIVILLPGVALRDVIYSEIKLGQFQ